LPAGFRKWSGREGHRGGWTDFDADGHLALKLVTRHGRATPLIWLSVLKDELSNARNDYEDVCLRRLAEVLPDDVQVTILAGFADTKLFGFLDELGFGYVIRLKGNIKVTAADGPTRLAAEWVGQGGRARKLRDATVTEAQCPVGAVVCVHAKAMKEPWCLVASDGSATAPQIIALYSKRWGVEPSFRDTKDLRFGIGLSSTRISDPQRRDRLLLLNAFAVVLLLGAAGESLGMISSPTPSKPAPIPCSAKAVCFTT
jgi:Transposase DDE domain